MIRAPRARRARTSPPHALGVPVSGGRTPRRRGARRRSHDWSPFDRSGAGPPRAPEACVLERRLDRPRAAGHRQRWLRAPQTVRSREIYTSRRAPCASTSSTLTPSWASQRVLGRSVVRPVRGTFRAEDPWRSERAQVAANEPSGGSGIRTHGELPHTRSPGVPIRPLSHPSGARVRPPRHLAGLRARHLRAAARRSRHTAVRAGRQQPPGGARFTGAADQPGRHLTWRARRRGLAGRSRR